MCPALTPFSTASRLTGRFAWPLRSCSSVRVRRVGGAAARRLRGLSLMPSRLPCFWRHRFSMNRHALISPVPPPVPGSGCSCPCGLLVRKSWPAIGIRWCSAWGRSSAPWRPWGWTLCLRGCSCLSARLLWLPRSRCFTLFLPLPVMNRRRWPKKGRGKKRSTRKGKGRRKLQRRPLRSRRLLFPALCS